jgi:hypothetical protein
VDNKEEVKIGAAILLRTFLRPGYEQFYTHTFDLAVAHLRLPRTPHPSEDPNTPLPLTTLSQALIVVFKEAFPLARQRRKERLLQRISRALLWLLQLVPASLGRRGSSRARMQIEQWVVLQSLDASKIHLDHAYLAEADLKQAWMVGASLRKADLSKADLSGANLSHAELRAASLIEADLREAYLSGANLEAARYLEDTNLRGAKGLTREQLEACKAKGAIIDEAPKPSPPQSPVSPPAPSQSKDAQAPSVPSAQVNIPPPDTWYWKAYRTHGGTTPAQASTPPPDADGSSAPSSKPSNGTQAPSTPPVQGSRPAPDTGGGSAPSSKLGPGA